MQEDTESFNENSNSEVIILSQSNHLEENSLSDEEETNTESALSYDAKLNAKLKELGLYEDGMTIQQKEELLAVVAVSFKTAEEEKNRRRWYEEYANAALTFPDDEIEFSLQQSPDPEGSPKASGFPQDFDEKFFNAKNSSEIEDKIEITEIRGFGNSNSNEYQSLPSTSQNYTTKLPPQRKRSKAVSSPHRLALEEGNTITVHPVYTLNTKNDFPTTNKEKRLYLEKSMSQWRPCMSPKDEPLISSRRPVPDEKGDCCIVPESEYNRRVNEFNQDVNLALTAIKHSRSIHSPFGKPYHLTKSGHCLKKTPKVDFYDIMVGVREELQESESDAGASESQNVKIETLPRTTECAFSHAQSHHDRINALKTNSSIVNNHSSITTSQLSTKYNVQQPIEQAKTFPEIVIEDDLDIGDIHIPDDFDLSGIDPLEKFDCENDFSAKLPKFSNLRPDLCRSKLSEKEVLNRDSSKTNSTRNCNESDGTSNFEKENHIDLSPQDGELSNSSSVIDVETIVDDEIEEFVLKRKLLQEPSVSGNQTYSNRPKRLKKNT